MALDTSFSPSPPICREQTTYKLAAIAASGLLTSTAVLATWYRFTMHTGVEEFPIMEFGLTLLLVLGGIVSVTCATHCSATLSRPFPL